ncbi:BT1A1 protein, partial [Cepphus grylle]|nr:BT1A1 protein [Cepphus grylle]
LFLAGEVPLTISIEPSVVLVEDEVTLSCQVTDNVPSNTGVLWYKMEKGRDAPLCSSSSLGGVVEQCKDEDEWRIVGHWKGRALLLVIQQVQVADEGTYVCALNGSAVTQEATTRLDVTAIGYKPTVDREVQEENMCRYTCKSKKWYPEPEVIWMNYGGDTVNVEAETNVTWSERDRFTVQSIITVPCDNLDVVCAVKLIKSKISRSGRSRFHTYICFLILTCLIWLLSSLVWIADSLPATSSPLSFPAQPLLHKAVMVVRTQKLTGECTPSSLQRIRENSHNPFLFVADDIKVDGNTAHPNLSIGVDEKSFTYKSQAQKMTQTERSFDSSVCVLGSEGFSSGKHYWEVDVEKSNDWDLGVAGKSAPKKGTISLSPTEGFWALGLSFKSYWARTDPWTRLVVQKNPRKVGVYLNCEEKMLTFFNVTDMSVMFTFKDCAFSEELYPFFKNSH